MTSAPADYIKSNAKTQVTEALKKVLANTYAIYFKTHSYHWNVEGPNFQALHTIFEEQYTELWTEIDNLAERLRALGVYAPANTKEMMEGAAISPAAGVPKAQDMVKELADDHTKMAKILVESIEITQEAGDEVTTDIFIGRAAIHEKTAWMLRSLAK